jgi:hypothetical protein
MVSVATKSNPFKEKIAGVKLFEADSGDELSTLNNLSSYPIGVALNCSIDFFNPTRNELHASSYCKFPK